MTTPSAFKNPVTPMSIRDDLLVYRQRELVASLPTADVVSVRVSKVLKRRLASKALELGTSESQLARFLLMAGLERYGVDGMAVL